MKLCLYGNSFCHKMMKRNSKDTDESLMQEKVILNLSSDILDIGVTIPELVKDNFNFLLRPAHVVRIQWAIFLQTLPRNILEPIPL